jgi:tetratricopeptide (TPR) repeat protein
MKREITSVYFNRERPMRLLMAFLIALTLPSDVLSQDNPVPPGRDRNKDAAEVLPLVRNCMLEHWDATTGKLGSNDLVITIRLDFRRDGALENEPKITHPIARQDFARLADNALKAVHKCVPLKNMPAETYYIWKAVVLHFVINKAAEEAFAHAHQANQYVAMGQFDRAIADYSKAIKKVPHAIAPHLRAEYYNSRAWAYFKAGKPAQGLPDVRKALELQPNYARALDTRGSIFEALGRREQAIADFRRALSLGANDPEVQASGTDALKRLGARP